MSPRLNTRETVTSAISYGLCVVLGLCGLLAAWKILQIIGGGTSSNAWNVLVAVGTLASASVALWLGLRDGRRVRRERAISGRLVAASLCTRLKGAVATLKQIQRRLNEISKSTPIDKDDFETNARRVLEFNFSISHDETVALAGVNQRAAILLTNGLATVILTQEAILSGKSNIPGAATTGNIAFLVNNLGNAIAKLEESMNQCKVEIGDDTKIQPFLPSE
ncbi:hypothetical protein [Burkholderia ubonensis]|uniref:hypothetical protein n=1 Tax=Burkholderia ubonensis TaxID=101571 RepID=UPI0012BA6725|nr:hypothetical protein [Burkholderia ubonensis]